ncbi:MAG TPA: tripartite tricarboxylate transporter substrate binding protein [Xanthobacteraceae bacterium]|nr:tripartite tricarboxylate transporter substrate binding protein [Xanthobacteraceae bacterium]
MNRSLTRTLLTALALAAVALPAAAQDWPTKTVRLIVPFGAGSTPDIVGRLLTDYLQTKLKQPFVVENKAGASGNTGTDAVAKADPDGYTVGISIGGPLAINPLLFGKLPYDPAKDLTLVTMLVTQPSALVVNASLNVNSVPELVALIKANPGKYNFGSIGNGSLSHLAMEAIALKTGTKMVHVPYASSPQAMTAVMRGDVQMACLPAIAVTPHLAGGQVKLLAISTAKRSDLLPGVPTLKESGIDVEADAWMGLIAPGNVLPPVVAAIGRAFTEAVTSQGVREKLKPQLMEPIPTTPAQFRARTEADIARWKPVIDAAKIKIN